MTFAEKLKAARKAAGISQEALAEKLGVSRQAVTKWETARGIPDIENMMTISNLFSISVDEFLSQEKSAAARKGHLYESRTEYDIDGPKRFDLKLGAACVLRVSAAESEKIAVCLSSDTMQSIAQDFKVRIEDIKGRIDVDVHRLNGRTEAEAKEQLLLDVALPQRYLSHVELHCHCDELQLCDLACEQVEFSGRTNKVRIDAVTGAVEIDCNLDMELEIKDFSGALDINQIAATSRLAVPADFAFLCAARGLYSAVSYERDGRAAEDFSDPAADNKIGFNGLKSELVICRKMD